MSIDDIVHVWKSNEDAFDTSRPGIPDNPVGQEISEHDLQQVAGGLWCEIVSCGGALSCMLVASASYTTTTY